MLDTNAVSAMAKSQANTLSASLKERLFCISVITEAELRFGLVRRAVNADLRRIVENFLASVDIRPWTSATAQRYALLRKELEALGKPLAPMDLLIAAHAQAEDCTLVSADRAFAQVPGLHVFNWSTSSVPAAVKGLVHARPPARQTTQKTKAKKKPNKKLKAK